MALSASSLAANIALAYQNFSNTNADGTPIIDSENTPTPPSASNNFETIFANDYNTYGTAGIVLGAINSGGDTSGFVNVIGSINNSSGFISAFASALVTYWSTAALINGTPAHGGVSVSKVVNDAGTKQSAFESAISSSYTQSKSEPFYLNFVQNIENVVKTIQWTVTEIMPNGSPSDFIETIT
jgi:hypothetical protein